MEDTEYNEFKLFFEKRIYPDDVYIGTSRTQIKGRKKNFRRKIKGIRLEDGKLMKQDLIEKRDRELLPKSSLQRVFRAYHASSTAGHFGVKKTLSKISDRYYWKGK
jgi:hypothetical protein